MRVVGSVVRLHRPPDATLRSPLAQLHWIFGQVEAEQQAERTAAMIRFARNKYLDYLTQTGAYYDDLKPGDRFILRDRWQPDALVRFNRWLNLQELATKTKYSIYKIVRAVMDFAYALRVLDLAVYHAPMFKGVIETEQRTAYTEQQQETINAELARWISLAASVVVGYERRGEGIPYKKLRRRGYDESSNASTPLKNLMDMPPRAGMAQRVTVEGVEYESIGKAAAAYKVHPASAAAWLRRGFTPEQSFGLTPRYVSKTDDRALLWSFENEFGCNSRRMLHELPLLESRISSARLRSLFVRWGVWPYVDDRLVMPLVTELAMLTALNFESLRSLTLASYVPSHPLTHQAAIRFVKTRAARESRSAENHLHLSSLEMEEVYIDGEKVDKVHRLITLVIKLTEKIRLRAPDEIKDKLFIFEFLEKGGSYDTPRIVDLAASYPVTKWYRRFKRESGLQEPKGEEVSFNISKCRPTLATNMVLNGASVAQVQAVLTHAEIESTFAYLDERQLRPLFNKTISEALTEISQRSKAAKERMTAQSSADPRLQPIQFHDTLSGAGCKDPFNPSENVRKATGHVQGSVCKFWNMCLLCDSSLVFEGSLPKLIAYSRRVKAAIEINSPSIQPKLLLLRQVDELLDGILMPDAIFSADVVSHAVLKAATLDDVMIDMLIYQGV